MTRTERNVVKPLEVPAWQIENTAESEVRNEAPAAQAVAARSSIDDFLSLQSSVRAAGPSPEKVVAAPTHAHHLGDALERCPHCGSRLSTIDLKFNRCLGCGKPPVQMASESEERAGQLAWTVRL